MVLLEAMVETEDECAWPARLPDEDEEEEEEEEEAEEGGLAVDGLERSRAEERVPVSVSVGTGTTTGAGTQSAMCTSEEGGKSMWCTGSSSTMVVVVVGGRYAWGMVVDVGE